MPTAQTPQLDRLRGLPKAEFHAHLEGCFEPGVLEQWARRAGVPLPRPRERLFEFEGLADFLHFLDWACGLAATREHVAELSDGYSRRLAEGGAGYADVIVNPTHWTAWHGRLPDLIDAIDAGFTAAEEDGLPPVGLCVSLLRTQSSDAALVGCLVDRQIPLGICPTSKLTLGVYASIEEHPIDRLRRAGVTAAARTSGCSAASPFLRGPSCIRCSGRATWPTAGRSRRLSPCPSVRR